MAWCKICGHWVGEIGDYCEKHRLGRLMPEDEQLINPITLNDMMGSPSFEMPTASQDFGGGESGGGGASGDY